MQQMGYRLNLRTKMCEKFKLTEPFRYFGVPDDARFDEDRIIGSLAAPGAGLEVARYEGETTDGKCVFTVHCSPTHAMLVCRLLCWRVGAPDPSVSACS